MQSKIEIELDSRLLSFNGRRFKLGRSEITILHHLSEKQEKATKEELLAIGWPHKVVSPNSVQVAIANIRRQLPKDAIITTDKGYHLNKKYQTEEQDNKGTTTPSKKPNNYEEISTVFGTSLVILFIISVSVYIAAPKNALLYKSTSRNLYTGNYNLSLSIKNEDELFTSVDNQFSFGLNERHIIISQYNSSYIFECIDADGRVKSKIINITNITKTNNTKAFETCF
ncbi:winged helix-turn-helix domain-containing protein [Shewanella waksmanii]|uniref:winged helix-turn-helix domain-containing protein n=1 Tax=Shewanella waksmanii TaxID=213783 RepID=UPI00048D46B0|nr:winged helix-turn-helix domain-containing protein [Shewanella waksmanii]